MICKKKLCCTLRSWVQNFLYVFGPSPAIVEQWYIEMMFQQFSIHNIDVTMNGKLSELHFHVLCFLYRWEKVPKNLKKLGPLLYYLMDLSLLFKNNHMMNCSSDNFPYMVTYMLCNLKGEVGNTISNTKS